MDDRQTQQIDAESAPMYSVIVPLYNKRHYILRAVRSVLSQGETDFKILTVDDGMLYWNPR